MTQPKANPSFTEVNGIAVGNKVRIKQHFTTNLYGDTYEAHNVGREGYVVRFSKKYDWEREPSQAVIRLYCDLNEQTGEYGQAYESFESIEHLEVIEATVGPVIAGQTCPYSRAELQSLFIQQQVQRVHSHDFTAQGYKNMATHLAAMYLNQDCRFHQQIEQLRRVDGTINPNKIAKAFKSLGLKIDELAFEAPLEFSNFNRLMYREIYQAIDKHQAVDWAEVADDFSECTC